MNYVEQHTWDTISRLLNELDPEHKGWCIDAGIGDGDYYFEWFRNMGHPTIAVEPLPTDAAREAIERSGASLIEAALGDGYARMEIYTAHGLHSLVDGLWGYPEQVRTIDVIRLNTVVPDFCEWSVLKLDIEGMEGVVLRQLRPSHLPVILSFEFGGVWNRAAGVGSWSEERVRELKYSLGLMDALGYAYIVIVSSGDSDKMQKLELPITDFDALFTPDTNWGNIIVWGLS